MIISCLVEMFARFAQRRQTVILNARCDSAVAALDPSGVTILHHVTIGRTQPGCSLGTSTLLRKGTCTTLIPREGLAECPQRWWLLHTASVGHFTRVVLCSL